MEGQNQTASGTTRIKRDSKSPPTASYSNIKTQLTPTIEKRRRKEASIYYRHSTIHGKRPTVRQRGNESSEHELRCRRIFRKKRIVPLDINHQGWKQCACAHRLDTSTSASTPPLTLIVLFTAFSIVLELFSLVLI